jgi:hypothetical protein
MSMSQRKTRCNHLPYAMIGGFLILVAIELNYLGASRPPKEHGTLHQNAAMGVGSVANWPLTHRIR